MNALYLSLLFTGLLLIWLGGQVLGISRLPVWRYCVGLLLIPIGFDLMDPALGAVVAWAKAVLA